MKQLRRLLRLSRDGIWYEGRFRAKNRLSSNVGVLSQESSPQVIISLTSFPKRIDHVYLAIESLLSQSVKPNRIILWLTTQELTEEQLPRTLTRQQSRGLEIRFVDQNLKAHNKLYFSVRDYPDAIVVTADDDIFYPRWWLQHLLATHQAAPENIICYRAKRLEFDSTSHQLKPYLEWEHPKTQQAGLDLLATGVSGTLYPPQCMPPEYFDVDAIREIAPHADDIWNYGMVLLAGRKTQKVFPECRIFSPVRFTQEQRLGSINNEAGQNDVQLAKVFERYDLHERLPGGATLPQTPYNQ